MKKIIFILLTGILFSGCLLVRADGTIIEPIQKNIVIETLEGTISIQVQDTDTGKRSVYASGKDVPFCQNRKTVFLGEGEDYIYCLLGNHSVVFDITTINSKAVFSITYEGNTETYIISSKDILGKNIYLKNYNY
ncbi:MAG: hypothetical protein MJ188_10250 [Treponema sp.]|nr:hypothetical protein [Treponema sp.]